MKLNVKTVLKNLEGKPFQTQKDDASVDLTIKDVILGVLISAVQPGVQETPDDKFKRYRLSTKVYDAKDDLEISAEDIALIKKLGAYSNWGIVVYGRLIDELEKPASPPAKK